MMRFSLSIIAFLCFCVSFAQTPVSRVAGAVMSMTASDVGTLASGITKSGLTGGGFGGTARLLTVPKAGLKVPWGGGALLGAQVLVMGLQWAYDEARREAGLDKLGQWWLSDPAYNDVYQVDIYAADYIRQLISNDQGVVTKTIFKMQVIEVLRFVRNGQYGTESRPVAANQIEITFNGFVDYWWSQCPNNYSNFSVTAYAASHYPGFIPNGSESYPGAFNCQFGISLIKPAGTDPMPNSLSELIDSDPSVADKVKTIVRDYMRDLDNQKNPDGTKVYNPLWWSQNGLDFPGGINVNQFHDDGIDCNLDTDSDGSSDCAEIAAGTDASDPASKPDDDADDDGLSQAEESQYGTDPNNPDTDNDQMGDGQEILLGTNPLSSDTDGDGIPDGAELSGGTDPKKADTDGDGLSDGAELAAGTDPKKADTDGDGLSDGAELAAGTDPKKADTDGDGVPDKADPHPLTPDCTGNKIWNPQKSLCEPPPTQEEPCPQGKHWSDAQNACIADPVTCDAGSEWSELLQKCIPKKDPQNPGSVAENCTIVEASDLESWATHFNQNFINLNKCLWIPKKSGTDYIDEIKSSLDSKFPFSLAASLQSKMIGGSDTGNGVPDWLPDSFGKFVLNFSPWLVIFSILSGGFKLALTVAFFSWLINKISGQVVIS